MAECDWEKIKRIITESINKSVDMLSNHIGHGEKFDISIEFCELDKSVMFEFFLDMPRLKDIGMRHSILVVELINDDIKMLMHIGGEIEIKETLTFTLAPYLRQFKEFIDEHTSPLNN